MMESSSTSDKIQRSFEKKMRLTEEKMQLVENIREKYKSFINREKLAKELTNKLFEPIVTPLKSLTKDKEKLANSAEIKQERVKEENKEEEEENTTNEEERVAGLVALTSRKGTGANEFESVIKKIIGRREKNPILGFNVKIDENTNDMRVTTRINKHPVLLNFDDKFIEINSKQYPLTKNLAELLFTAKVSNLNPSPAEVDIYNQLLHDVGDFPSTPTKKEENKYYRFIRQPEKQKVLIKKLSKKGKALVTDAGPSYLRGGGGPNLKNLNLKVFSRKNQDVKYIYWNSPSELIHRLCLLISAKQAGNTSPQVDEEIQSIEEELREANIIE